MQCNCGNGTKKVTEKIWKATLSYEMCGACGQVGGRWLLTEKGKPSIQGEEARLMFLRMARNE